MERIPSPTFEDPVQWLRVGDMQLHLFLDDEALRRLAHHLGITIDDFDAAYEAVKARASDVGLQARRAPVAPGAALLPRPERQPDRAQLAGTPIDRSRYPECGGSPITSRRSPTRRKPSSTSTRASDGRSTAATWHPEEAARAHCRATALAAHRRLGAVRGARRAARSSGCSSSRRQPGSLRRASARRSTTPRTSSSRSSTASRPQASTSSSRAASRSSSA